MNYSAQKNIQILISLMKAHGIKKIVASPGTTNAEFISSIQDDSFFEIYSSPEERSAAYMACGLAAETGEPVAISCTGATASRNYMPALTEAYYRKLPILAITSTQRRARIGHHIPQIVDRTVVPNDVVKMSVYADVVYDEESAWSCGVEINRAMLELCHHGGGPVHIDLAAVYGTDFSVKELPPVKIIRRIMPMDTFPMIQSARVAIFVGNHAPWSDALTDAVDIFCESYNAIVICDHTSNYKGKFAAHAAIVSSQEQYTSPYLSIDLMIHIGEISGAYFRLFPKEVWRVSPDGEIRDTFHKLTNVFEMEEINFFRQYIENTSKEKNNSYFSEWQEEYNKIFAKIPADIPFSNIWIAMQTAAHIPAYSTLHLGILNSLRSWNFFNIPENVQCEANTGGFGIDGPLSTAIGASLANTKKLHFCITGDLAFFYDMNSLGNRHVCNNLRILVINNGKGTEFRNYNHYAARFGDSADEFVAAAGHYGKQSENLIRHYAQDLGFTYLSAKNKEEYLTHLLQFVSSAPADKSIVLEVFTDSQDESRALEIINNLEVSLEGSAKKKAREILGDKGIRTIKKLINR